MTPVYRMRVEHGARHLHTLGPRVIAELLIEVARRSNAVATLLDVLDDYSRLTPEIVRAAGADRFPVHVRSVPSELARGAA